MKNRLLFPILFLLISCFAFLMAFINGGCANTSKTSKMTSEKAGESSKSSKDLLLNNYNFIGNENAVSDEISASDETSTNANEIKVMTFNIRASFVWHDCFLLDLKNNWDNRKQIVFDTFTNNNPDVMGLQEVRACQFEQIQNVLSQYSGYAVYRKAGEQRSESCPIFYRKDRFELIDSGTFWFSSTPEKPGSKYPEIICPRICSWVCLFDYCSERRFYVFNLHLDPYSQNSRQKSLGLLADKIAARKTKDPVIVMGDFNMKINNTAMNHLKNMDTDGLGSKFVSSWLCENSDEKNLGTTHNFNDGKTSGWQIDHIFVSQQMKVLETSVDHYQVNGRYPSDHFAVIAKILN